MQTAQLAGHGITLFLLLCAWIVALGGLAALQERCNWTDIFFFSNITSLAPKKCSEFYSYQWWQIALEFFFWMYYATVLAVGEQALKQQKLAISSLTAVLMLLYMGSTTLFYDMLVAEPKYMVQPANIQVYSNISFVNSTAADVDRVYDDYVSGSLKTRLQVCASGFALVVFFHCILIFILSPFEDEESEVRSVGGKGVGGDGSPPPPPGQV